MRRLNRIIVAICFCMTTLLCHQAYAAGCFTAPYSCNPPGDINPQTPHTYAARYEAYAQFAWHDFIALNFPAAGTPDKPQPIPSAEHGLNYNGGAYTTVWETWPEASDIFRPGATPPPGFGSGHTTPALCPTPDGAGKIVLSQTVVLDEYVQANRMGPVIDQNGNYVRFGINFNQPMLKYMVDNKLYSQEGQTAHDKDNPNRDRQTVLFPRGSYKPGEPLRENMGSIFIKSAWKILTAQDDQTKFYRTEAYVYEKKGGAFDDEPTVKEQCEKKTLGLVGLHIVHLTNSAPQWVWATFEHVNNAPWLKDFSEGTPTGKYSFFDATKCASKDGKPDCHFDDVPAQPWNPQVPGQHPGQLIRAAAPGEYALKVNAEIKLLIERSFPKSVWTNYFLVDVQFPTNTKPSTADPNIANPNPAYPDGVPTPTFLANSTMETYIPGFYAGQITTSGNQIPEDDQMQTLPAGAGKVNPFGGLFHNISGGANRATSTCVGCHADAAMMTGSSGDFVFSLSRAEKASPTVAMLKQKAAARVSVTAPLDASTLRAVSTLQPNQ